MTIDRALLAALRPAIETALAPVAEKFKLRSLKAGNCTFDPSAGSFTFKLEGVANAGQTKEETAYELLRLHWPKLPAVGSRVKIGSRECVIVGANKTGSKVLYSRDGGTYQMPVAQVALALAAQ